MKYLFINSVAGYGSTGRLAAQTCRELMKEGHECVLAFGRMCDIPVKEGSGVRVVGRLKENKWTDGDGVTHSEVQIVAEHIEIRKSK